jgi:hypothetical protein
MHALPVTYPHGPVALTHALIPGPPYHPGPPYQGPPPSPPQSSPPWPWPWPWPGSCGHVVTGVPGEIGTALAIPTPHPRAVKLQAPPITAAAIIILRFTMPPWCDHYRSISKPSLIHALLRHRDGRGLWACDGWPSNLGPALVDTFGWGDFITAAKALASAALESGHVRLLVGGQLAPGWRTSNLRIGGHDLGPRHARCE